MAHQVNRYGLDFLRREHVLEEVGSTAAQRAAGESRHQYGNHNNNAVEEIDTEALAASVAHKPDLEKQFDIIHFLQAHRSAGWMPPSVIYQRTGIDLEEDSNVAQMLQRNPKIKVETVPDPENPSLTIDTYAYQAKYNNVRNRSTLLAQINRCKNGAPMRDLMDSYDTVMDDLDSLICGGEVLALYNTEDKDKVLFPRGEPFFVELDGIISPPTHNKNKKRKLSSDGNDKNTNSNDDSNTNSNSSPVKTQEQENAPQNASEGETKNNHNDNATKIKEENGEAKEGDTATGSSEITDTGGTSKATTALPPADEAKSPEKPVSNSNSASTANSAPTSSSSPKKDAMLPPNSPPRPVYCVETDSDPRSQVRRGEAIQIGGSWFRVSSAVKEGPLKDQPARATAPLSVVSREDLSKRNEIDGYIRPFTQSILPADAALPPEAIQNLIQAKEARERLLKLAHGGRAGGAASQLLGTNAHASNPVALAASLGTSQLAGARRRPHKHAQSVGGSLGGNARSRAAAQEAMAKLKEAALDPYLSLYSHPRRHGCTKDVRELYLKTRSLVPQNDADLKAALVQHKLLDPGEEMRRPRLQPKGNNVDNDGKPKKRRYYERKNQRMTNTHLEGTEIGAVLRRATEKQQQGQQVGDGGM